MNNGFKINLFFLGIGSGNGNGTNVTGKYNVYITLLQIVDYYSLLQ